MMLYSMTFGLLTLITCFGLANNANTHLMTILTAILRVISLLNKLFNIFRRDVNINALANLFNLVDHFSLLS